MAEVGIQYCGLALIVLLIFFTYRRKSLGLHSDRSYHMALVASFICLSSDVLSIHALAHLELWPQGMVYFICRLYICSLLYVSFFAFTYIACDAFEHTIRRRMGIISGVVVLIGTVLQWVLPIHIHAVKGELYTYGPAVTATYVFCISYVLMTIVFALVLSRYVNHRRTVSVLVWMVIWLLAAMIQFFNSNLPMVGFATALGLTILFADLENPEAHIDRETGVFTAHALMSYMTQQYEEDKAFAGINIVINTDESGLSRNEGRSMLVTVARRLELIPGAMVFRNVANEFALVFKSKEEMEAQYPNIRRLLEEPIATEAGSVHLHPYYILFPDSMLAYSADEVFAYHSFFMPHDPEMDYRIIDEEEVKHIREGIRIRGEISDALREDRVEVFFHPIFSVEKQRFTSAEALARIRNRDGSLMMPGAFIPVAETSDQIIHIGQRVFEKSCEFLSKHDVVELGIDYIEINLSVQQCQRKSLATEFIEIMERYHVKPGQINLEITESGSVKYRKTLLANMNALMEAGVRFSLDDFGTGESNLDYIMNMPVDIIKFDRTLTQSYFANDRTKYVIDSVIEMIKGLHLEIVSEGVETESQYLSMKDKEIDYIQGYYFAKPMPAEEFLYFVKMQ